MHNTSEYVRTRQVHFVLSSDDGVSAYKSEVFVTDSLTISSEGAIMIAGSHLHGPPGSSFARFLPPQKSVRQIRR
jgi:hypothetical protein